MPKPAERCSNEDQQIVERLLGRPARVPFIVLTRCPDGAPQVVTAEPVFWEEDMWKPFPTVFWLLCPKLRLAISHLEQGGFLKNMLARMEREADLRESYLRGQAKIGAERVKRACEMLSEPLSPKIEKVLRETSIAGSHNLMGLKCLHSHAAHSLAGGENPVGAAVLETIGKCDGRHADRPNQGERP